ncbi:poly-gamma-glutamate biosynthesis protein [Jiangella anatolica]|uniref:Poly-gamma-glutamate biosynthesis protein n=1 Tax=Jiangella anatolica TaxID=2670374 RepID=A0A2W2AXD2_9ACTN|nr:poly-gamma-glutamate biosynthesis protein [Jiangella anatolica]
MLAALVAAVVVTGCGSGSGDDDLPAAGSPPASPTRTQSPTPTPTPTPTPPPRPITLAFAGDVHFEGELRPRLDDPATALAPIAPQLSAADLTIVNLESSVGTSGDPEPGKEFTFQAPPTALTALQAAGVDVATMANNHGMDFGPEGLADTLAARTTVPGLDVVGVGANIDEAFAPAIREIDGTTVAVIGASVPDDPVGDPTGHWAATATTAGVATALDPAALLAAVAAAKSQADVVVVYLHWGNQGEGCPSESQRSLASALAADADIVVGAHTHQLQGSGLAPVGEAYVAYGLGNFVWYTQRSEITTVTGVLTLTVENGAVTADDWAPARIGDDGLPAFATGGRADEMIAGQAALRECTDLRPLP